MGCNNVDFLDSLTGRKGHRSVYCRGKDGHYWALQGAPAFLSELHKYLRALSSETPHTVMYKQDFLNCIQQRVQYCPSHIPGHLSRHINTLHIPDKVCVGKRGLLAAPGTRSWY